MNKLRLQRLARKIKIFAEGEMGIILDVRIYIITKEKMKELDFNHTKGLYNGLNSIYVCPENIVNTEKLFNGFIKTVAHELRHYWQYETGKTSKKIYQKYLNKAERYYGDISENKKYIREEADAYQFESRFFRKYSRRFRRF
jgi:hypothetical protein